MKITFVCPGCERPARVICPGRAGGVSPLTGSAHEPGGLRPPLAGSIDWQCPHCDHRLTIEPAAPDLPTCVICGNKELYKKKAFPHGLGMTILVVACLASVFTYGWYEKWATYAILIGTALFDGVLYLMVGDVIVCYRCNAYYGGVQPSDRHKPHELIVGERYRQERIRREQLRQP